MFLIVALITFYYWIQYSWFWFSYLEKCITAFSLNWGLFSFVVFSDIVDFEEDFIEKGGKINELRYSDCRRFLVLGITDTVVICEVTF